MARSIPLSLGLLVLLLCFDPRVVRADQPTAKTIPLYVLTIWTEDADDQADALTKALQSRVLQAPGWTVVQTTQSFETLAIALKCPSAPDPACLQRIGDQLKADDYVWGTMERTNRSGEVRVELHLWTRGKPTVAARATYPDKLKDAADESLRAIARDLLVQLTGGVASTPPAPPQHAEPTTAPASGPVPASAAGPVSASTSTSTQDSASAAPSARDTNRASPARTALAYTALVLGGGLLVASAVEAAKWISDDNESRDDRRSIPRSVTDVCAETARPLAVDACSKGKDAVRASTFAWVFAGAGAALVGTGLWLVGADRSGPVTADSEVSHATQKARFALLPSIGPRSGTLDVRLTF